MIKYTGNNHTLAQRFEDESGYPNMNFEDWYQQGINCWDANLPKWLRKIAFQKIVKAWKAKNKLIEMWHIRAFVFGSKGRCSAGYRGFRVNRNYVWPTPPDPSWELFVCIYVNYEIDLDLIHHGSKRFMSEDCGFFKMPDYHYGPQWYEEMGFSTIYMVPISRAEIGIGKRVPLLETVK